MPPHQTLREVARLYQFTSRYLRELVRRHNIPVLGSGRMIRFDAPALDALETALRCRSQLSAAHLAGMSSPSPAPSRARASVVERRVMTLLSPEKRQSPSKPKSCAANGMGS